MRTIIILSLVAVILLSYCQNNAPIPVKIPNKTLSQDSLIVVTDTMSIPDFWCLTWGPPAILDTSFKTSYQQQYIIRNQNDYDSLIINNCTSLEPNCPIFNFSNHFLVGFRVMDYDSNTTCKKTLMIDSLNKKYIYQLTVTTRIVDPLNKICFFTMNWLSVPSFPNDWSFVFDTTQVLLH